MESAKQVASMIANTGVVFFAGTTVAFFLNPVKTSPITAAFGMVFWVTCLFFAAVIAQKEA